MKIIRHVTERSAMRLIRSYLRASNTYFMVGMNSIYVPNRNEKYIDKAVAREWADSDGEIVWMTPGEAARTELKRAFPSLRRVGWQRDHVHLFDARWPMYFSGPYKGEGVYIDLKGAYYQLYRRLWLDVCYPRGMGTLDLMPVAEKLAHWKAARNGVIGVTISRSATGIKGPRRIKLQTKNEFLSPHLWATIQGLLNELAMVAIELGCIYVATDGYIFPSKSNWVVFQHYLEEVGLQFHRYIDDVDIRGWTSYAVGESKVTVPYFRGQLGGQQRITQVEWPLGDRTGLLRWWSVGIEVYRERMALL